MKNIILLFTLLLFITSCNSEKQDDNIEPINKTIVDINDEGSFESKTKSGVSLIFYHATWCTKCKSQRSAIEGLLNVPSLSAVNFLQVDYEKTKSIVESQKVTGFPTIVIKKNGEEKARFEGGGHTKEQLEKKLNELL